MCVSVNMYICPPPQNPCYLCVPLQPLKTKEIFPRTPAATSAATSAKQEGRLTPPRSLTLFHCTAALLIR